MKVWYVYVFVEGLKCEIEGASEMGDNGFILDVPLQDPLARYGKLEYILFFLILFLVVERGSNSVKRARSLDGNIFNISIDLDVP